MCVYLTEVPDFLKWHCRAAAWLLDGRGSGNSIMPRPKRLKEPVKINLLIEKDSKQKAINLALKRRTSVGRLFETWLQQDLNGPQPDEDCPPENLKNL